MFNLWAKRPSWNNVQFTFPITLSTRRPPHSSSPSSTSPQAFSFFHSLSQSVSCIYSFMHSVPQSRTCWYFVKLCMSHCTQPHTHTHTQDTHTDRQTDRQTHTVIKKQKKIKMCFWCRVRDSPIPLPIPYCSASDPGDFKAATALTHPHEISQGRSGALPPRLWITQGGRPRSHRPIPHALTSLPSFRDSPKSWLHRRRRNKLASLIKLKTNQNRCDVEYSREEEIYSFAASTLNVTAVMNHWTVRILWVCNFLLFFFHYFWKICPIWYSIVDR